MEVKVKIKSLPTDSIQKCPDKKCNNLIRIEAAKKAAKTKKQQCVGEIAMLQKEGEVDNEIQILQNMWCTNGTRRAGILLRKPGLPGL